MVLAVEKQKLQVMMVEDHPIFRYGMTMLINSLPDMAMCYQCSNVQDATTWLDGDYLPDIVLVDIALEGSSGFELLKYIRKSGLQLLTLVISSHDELLYAERALETGAHGYVMKHESIEIILEAIRDVLAGRIFLSGKMRTKLVQRMVDHNALAPPLIIGKLTPSEFEVLHLISEGHGTQNIARLLNRSVKTIEAHRANMRRKIGLKDGTQLLRYALQLQQSLESQPNFQCNLRPIA